MQVGQWSKSKIVGAVALGLAAAVLQGWLVFVLMEWPGSFVSVTGLKCVGRAAVDRGRRRDRDAHEIR